MFIFSESSPTIQASASAADLAASTEVAKLIGCRVYHIPDDFSASEGAENALCYLAPHPQQTHGVWVGYIPTIERYRALYSAAQQKNFLLLNTPAQHEQSMRFDLAYPHIEGLTPKSAVISSLEDLYPAASAIGFPIFIKGTIQSTKAEGWSSCVANNAEELAPIVERLLRLTARSRGKVILRELVSLRHSRTSGLGFPLGREYRVFLYQGEVLASGYYWEGDDPLRVLSSSEERQVHSLAKEAASRLSVPYLAVDIGQRTDGEWIVIEVGDAQFCGASQVSLWALWGGLLRVLG